MQTTILILQVALLLLGLYIVFLKSYFTEKGKNLATKEDIEDITKKVESIRTEFIKETEKLKIDLQFENHVKISFNIDMKNCVIQTFENYHLWLNLIMDAHSNSLDFSSKKLKFSEEKIEETYSKFLMSESKLLLYEKDMSFFELLTDIKVKTLELQSVVEKYLIEVESIIEEEEHLENIVVRGVEKELSKLNNEKIKLFNLHHKDILKEYGAIFNKMLEFRDVCHAKIIEK